MNIFQDLASMFNKNQFVIGGVPKAKDYLPIGIDKGNKPGTPVNNPEARLVRVTDLASAVANVLETASDFNRLRVIGDSTAQFNPVENTSLVTFAKRSSDNALSIAFNEKVQYHGSQASGTNQYGRMLGLEVETAYTGGYPQLVAQQVKSEFKGTGNAYFVIGQINIAEMDGDNNKQVNSVYGHSNQVRLKGSGTDTTQFVIAHHNTIDVDNADQDINNIYSGYYEIDVNAGATINDAYQLYLDYKKSSETLVNYKGIYHKYDGSATGTAQFIHNEADLPLDTAGAVNAKELNLNALNSAPASASATGTPGQIRIDANHIYVCVANNTWKRAALSTF
tara:strand:- start:118 stop:1128 length:1011 start_codon:yes stop_codon:yes gene_type:complete